MWCVTIWVGCSIIASHEQPLKNLKSVASRTLSKSERNYSQIYKEGLTIVFAGKKFHQYGYGRHFTI